MRSNRSGEKAPRRYPCIGDAVEVELLEDLAAASRILADQGVFDAAGHVSMRHPDDPKKFLMSRSLAPALVTDHDILELTIDGESLDARGRAPFIERHLHAGIYRHRPDVMAVRTAIRRR
jgi:HCOMODA/2-hydroxy-3-carboxy-muconic semialdehyde decarboxylase